MNFSVRLKPSERCFSVAEGQTVLAAAAAAEIGLPQACKKGICRTCIARVLEGEVTQKHTTLSSDAIKAGYALLCQSVPSTDLVIEARILPVMPKLDSIRAIVTDMQLLSHDVMRVALRLPPRQSLHFKAGQYIEIVLGDDVRRSYSLATVPKVEGNWSVELHIRHCVGGRFTDRVFEGMKPREALTISGPMGTFFLREDSDKPIILVASGTGYAPVRSLLQHALEVASHREIVLYWGGRAKADIYLAEEPIQWSAQYKNFRFIPVLSEPLVEDAWQGRTGFVHRAVMADFPDLSGVQVYACGAPVMVEAAQHDFVKYCGLPDDEFYADAFLNESDLVKEKIEI
ncbi:TPA: 2Fe-2S iron-sulfur cluster binding domain-containing protein [Burkholderia cenocepacia]|nr:2Fe-2S iron-sulfur cluster binding domain-containing protein [Burkholderia cenocepacia]